MPSAIQVKENEKRKHASLTIVGTKYDFALRLGGQDKNHYTGTLFGGRNDGVLCNDARYARGKNR
jgi:hypothetical protein